MANRPHYAGSQKGELHFEVDSRLLYQLGEHLVAQRWIALAELVKNAYDADATKVTIRFLNVTKPGGTIIVEDNGEGMTFEVVKNAWMRIATTYKEEHTRSRIYKRPLTGAKGIGRIACRRISKTLIMESVAELTDKTKEKIEVIFDWSKFEPGSNVDEIPVRYSINRVSPETLTGVTLKLENLHEVWTEKDIADFAREIRDLNTFSLELHGHFGLPKTKDPGFVVYIESPEFPEYRGPILEQFLKNSWGYLKGTLDKEGKAKYVLKIRDDKTYTFEPERRFVALGPAQFSIHIFIYMKRVLGPGIRTSEARRIGEERGGVRVFMDEFRVPAYGSRGDDWLSLDYERGRRLMALPEGLISEAEGLWRPMLDLFGNNQLFGWVFLSRFKNPSIEITINRDRFYENDAFLNLKKFVRLGIDWATVRYSGWKEEEKKERAEVKELRPDEVLKKVRETVEEASKQLGDERTGQIIRSLESVQAAFQRQIEKQIDEISMLRVLASTGTMIFIFDHEIQLLISDLADIITELRSLIPILPADQKKKFTDHLSRLEDWKEKADQQILHLGRMLGSEARRQPREFALKPIVDQMALPFRRFMDGEDINFINDVQPDIRTPPMFEAELHAILLNLMTNSLKAVRGQPKRQICVKTKIKEKKLIIHFLDSGRGLPIERREVVFRPFESDSEPDLLLGHGTGLGLKIVRDIIRDYGGDAQFIDAPVPWKTCLEVILPVED